MQTLLNRAVLIQTSAATPGYPPTTVRSTTRGDIGGDLGPGREANGRVGAGKREAEHCCCTPQVTRCCEAGPGLEATRAIALLHMQDYVWQAPRHGYGTRWARAKAQLPSVAQVRPGVSYPLSIKVYGTVTALAHARRGRPFRTPPYAGSGLGSPHGRGFQPPWARWQEAWRALQQLHRLCWLPADQQSGG